MSQATGLLQRFETDFNEVAALISLVASLSKNRLHDYTIHSVPLTIDSLPVASCGGIGDRLVKKFYWTVAT
jgi:hypothetical protein